MTSKIQLLSEENNETITMIINKLEEEIKVLISEIYSYEFVKFEYNIREYFNELQCKYSRECEINTDKSEEYKKIIKHLSNMRIKIYNSNTTDFSKLAEIVKKQEMIETLKKIGKFEHIDEILKVIKK